MHWLVIHDHFHARKSISSRLFIHCHRTVHMIGENSFYMEMWLIHTHADIYIHTHVEQRFHLTALDRPSCQGTYIILLILIITSMEHSKSHGTKVVENALPLVESWNDSNMTFVKVRNISMLSNVLSKKRKKKKYKKLHSLMT